MEQLTKFKKGDLIECTSTSIARVKLGERFIVVDVRPRRNGLNYCPELVYIRVPDRGVTNYSPKHFKLVEEIGEDMARDNVVNKSSNPIYERFKQTASQEANITDWGYFCSAQSTDYVNKEVSNLNNKGEVNMNNTNRKTVTVNLIDRDTSLDEKHALVATFGQFTTAKSPEALIRSIIMEPKNEVAKLIEQHNEVRTKQINKEILQRTGNKVHLEPVEESDLYWEIL